MAPEIMTVLDGLKKELKTLYGARLFRVLLFGSQARKDAAAGSDVDVLVVLKGDVKPGKEIALCGEMTADLSLQHDIVLSLTFISESRFEKEESPLLINVRREGVPV
jgi:predicted nucleotidyltransferase